MSDTIRFSAKTQTEYAYQMAKETTDIALIRGLSFHSKQAVRIAALENGNCPNETVVLRSYDESPSVRRVAALKLPADSPRLRELRDDPDYLTADIAKRRAT